MMCTHIGEVRVERERFVDLITKVLHAMMTGGGCEDRGSGQTDKPGD